MISDTDCAIQPCKIIFTAGAFQADAEDHHKTIPLERACAPDPVKRQAIPGAHRYLPERRVERPAVQPQPVRPTFRYSSEQVKDMTALCLAGKPVRDVAAITGISQATIYRLMEGHLPPQPAKPKRVDALHDGRNQSPYRQAMKPSRVRRVKTLRPLPPRGPSPLRLPHVTVESINALKAEGKDVPAIALALECSVDVIYARLRSVTPFNKFIVTEGYHFPGTLLTAIREVDRANHSRQVLCRCECGDTATVQLSAVRQGRWRSCGHLLRKLTPVLAASIREKRAAGARVVDLCAEFKVSDETIRRAVTLATIEPNITSK